MSSATCSLVRISTDSTMIFELTCCVLRRENALQLVPARRWSLPATAANLSRLRRRSGCHRPPIAGGRAMAVNGNRHDLHVGPPDCPVAGHHDCQPPSGASAWRACEHAPPRICPTPGPRAPHSVPLLRAPRILCTSACEHAPQRIGPMPVRVRRTRLYSRSSDMAGDRLGPALSRLRWGRPGPASWPPGAPGLSRDGGRGAAEVTRPVD